MSKQLFKINILIFVIFKIFFKIPYNHPIQLIINDNVSTHATGIKEVSRPLREK